jgi:hypothetical protein
MILGGVRCDAVMRRDGSASLEDLNFEDDVGSGCRRRCKAMRWARENNAYVDLALARGEAGRSYSFV